MVIFGETAQVVERTSNVLQGRGIRSTSIVGGRSRVARSSAVSSFSNDPSVKVILLTTGSAAAGTSKQTAFLSWAFFFVCRMGMVTCRRKFETCPGCSCRLVHTWEFHPFVATYHFTCRFVAELNHVMSPRSRDARCLEACTRRVLSCRFWLSRHEAHESKLESSVMHTKS